MRVGVLAFCVSLCAQAVLGRARPEAVSFVNTTTSSPSSSNGNVDGAQAGVEATSTATSTKSSASSTIKSTSSHSITASASLNLTLSPSDSTTCGNSDIACGLACNALWQSWNTASQSFASAHTAEFKTIVSASHYTVAYTSTSWSFPPNPAVFTLCDGVPRVNATPATITYTSTTSRIQTLTITTGPTLPNPSPSCSINPNLCFNLVSALSAQGSGQIPACDQPPGYDAIVQPNGDVGLDFDGAYQYDGCAIGGGTVRLGYWPVSTAGGLCATNGSTIAPITTGPSTIVTWGTTLTSPTVYLSFDTLFAISWGLQYWNNSYVTVLGQNLTNVVVPEAATAVSSICFASGLQEAADLPIQTGYAEPINYADLNEPIRASVYNCAANLSIGLGNGTIWNNYAPQLAFPTDLSKVQSAWSGCLVGAGSVAGFGNDFVFDPPTALVASTVNVPALTTLAAKPTTTSAAPITQPGAPTVKPTSTLAPVRTTSVASSEPESLPAESTQSSQVQTDTSSQADPSTADQPQADPSTVDTSADSSQADPAASTQAQEPASKTTSTVAASSAQGDPTQAGASAVVSSVGQEPSSAASQSSQAANIASLIMAGLGSTPGASSDHASTGQGPLSTQSAGSDPSAGSQGEVSAAVPTSAGILASTTANIGSDPLVSAVISAAHSDVPSSAQGETPGSVSGEASSAGSNAILVTIGSQVHSAVSTDGAVIIASQTITPGQAAVTIDGNVVSAVASGVVVHGSTQAFTSVDAVGTSAAQPNAVAQTLVTIGSQVQSAVATGSVIVINSNTITRNGPAATISGVVLSADSSAVIVGGTTIALAQPTDDVAAVLQSTNAAQSSASAGPYLVTIGSDVLTAQQSTGSSDTIVYYLGTHAVTAGAVATTIDGETVSAFDGGVQVGTSTIALTSITSASSISGQAALATAITLVSGTLTAAELSGGSGVVIAGTTLTVGGPAAEIDGTVVSAASSGVVVGGGGSTGKGSATTSTSSRGSSGPGTSVAGAASATSTSSASARRRVGSELLGTSFVLVVFLLA